MELLKLLVLLLSGCLDPAAKSGCAVDSDCNPGRVCGSDGTCRSASCPPLSGNTVYVDFNAAGDGNGSFPGCALKNIGLALAAVATAEPWTVIVRGGATLSTNTTHVVPGNVSITGGTVGTGSGHGSNFAACTSSDSCPSDSWPVVNISSTTNTAFAFKASGPGGLRYFTITGPPLSMASPQAPTSTQDGVHLIDTGPMAVHLEHLRIKFFLHGVAVDPGGNVAIDDDVMAELNFNGLAGRDGSSVTVLVGDGQEPTYFNNNLGDGIHIDPGAARFTLQGPPAPSPGALAPGVGVSFNAGDGIYYAAAAPGALISGLNCHKNSGSGIVLVGGSVMRVRSCHVYDNQMSGILVIANGANTQVSALDLGADAGGADAGLNVLYGNGAANLCAGIAVSDDQPAGSLHARGNDFTNYHQANPSPKSCAAATVLSVGPNCASGVDVSDDGMSVIDVTDCSFQ